MLKQTFVHKIPFDFNDDLLKCILVAETRREGNTVPPCGNQTGRTTQTIQIKAPIKAVSKTLAESKAQNFTFIQYRVKFNRKKKLT